MSTENPKQLTEMTEGAEGGGIQMAEERRVVGLRNEHSHLPAVGRCAKSGQERSVNQLELQHSRNEWMCLSGSPRLVQHHGQHPDLSDRPPIKQEAQRHPADEIYPAGL